MSKQLNNWQHWVLQNIQLLNNRYGKNNVALNMRNWQSIVINNFSLPNSWQHSHTKLLIILPKGSKIFYSPPDRFYLNWGLKAINGRVPGHYFEKHGFNDLAKEKVARFSFHVDDGWNPNLNSIKGTNLLHVLDGLYQGMHAAALEVI